MSPFLTLLLNSRAWVKRVFTTLKSTKTRSIVTNTSVKLKLTELREDGSVESRKCKG